MRTCERLVSMGRFTPSEPAGLLARSYYELLESKQPILGIRSNLWFTNFFFFFFFFIFCEDSMFPGRSGKQGYINVINVMCCMAFSGSSTACVIVLNKETSSICSANIGDSGFVVVRKGEVVHRSSEQQHYFNTPFQLSFPPPGHSGLVLSDRYYALQVHCQLTLCI